MAIGPFLEKRVAERRLHSAYFKDLKVGRRDKEARARAIQGRMQQGRVFVPEDAVWTGLLWLNFCVFLTACMMTKLMLWPGSVYDDRVCNFL